MSDLATRFSSVLDVHDVRWLGESEKNQWGCTCGGWSGAWAAFQKHLVSKLVEQVGGQTTFAKSRESTKDWMQRTDPVAYQQCKDAGRF